MNDLKLTATLPPPSQVYFSLRVNRVPQWFYRPAGRLEAWKIGHEPDSHSSKSSTLPAGLKSIPLFLTLLLLTVVLIFPPTLQAQNPIDAEVEFFVKTPEAGEQITVGDQVVLRLEIVHPSDSRVVLPQLEEQWESFIVVDQSPPQTVDQGDGTAITGKDITVSLFQPGEYETPPVIVTHRTPDGTIEELAAPIVPVRVTSVLTDESELRDLKPQAELSTPPLWPLILLAVLAAVLLTAALAYLAMWLRRRWQQRPEPAFEPVAFVDTRPPEIIAHAELDRIEALDLPQRNEVKSHYSLVATCLRRYIEGRYNVQAVEQTTSELRDNFSRSEAPMRDVSSLMSLITESDWVKFARYTPDPEEVHNLVSKARSVVDATTPVIEETTPEPPPPSPPEKEEMVA